MVSKAEFVAITIFALLLSAALWAMGIPKYFLLVPLLAIILLGISVLQLYRMSKMLGAFAAKNGFRIATKKDYDIQKLTNDLDPVTLSFQGGSSFWPGMGFNIFSAENPIVAVDNMLFFAGTRTSVQRDQGAIGKRNVDMNGIFIFFDIAKTTESVSFVCYVPAKRIGAGTADIFSYAPKISRDVDDLERNSVFQTLKPIIESSRPQLIFELTAKENKVIVSITSVGQTISEADIGIFFTMCRTMRRALG